MSVRSRKWQTLAEPMTAYARPVTIIVWINREFKSFGQELKLHRNCLKSWNCVLEFLTDTLKPRFGAVRRIYHLDTKQQVQSIQDLKPMEKYIAVGSEKVKFKGYLQAPDRSTLSGSKSSSGGSYVQQPDNTTWCRCPDEFMSSTKKKKRTVAYFIVSGRYSQRPLKVVFIERDLMNSNMTISYLAYRLDVAEGIADLYTVNGNVINVADLKHGEFYIAVPFGLKFQKLNYAELFQDYLSKKKIEEITPKNGAKRNRKSKKQDLGSQRSFESKKQDLSGLSLEQTDKLVSHSTPNFPLMSDVDKNQEEKIKDTPFLLKPAYVSEEKIKDTPFLLKPAYVSDEKIKETLFPPKPAFVSGVNYVSAFLNAIYDESSLGAMRILKTQMADNNSARSNSTISNNADSNNIHSNSHDRYRIDSNKDDNISVDSISASGNSIDRYQGDSINADFNSVDRYRTDSISARSNSTDTNQVDSNNADSNSTDKYRTPINSADSNSTSNSIERYRADSNSVNSNIASGNSIERYRADSNSVNSNIASGNSIERYRSDSNSADSNKADGSISVDSISCKSNSTDRYQANSMDADSKSADRYRADSNEVDSIRADSNNANKCRSDSNSVDSNKANKYRSDSNSVDSNKANSNSVNGYRGDSNNVDRNKNNIHSNSNTNNSSCLNIQYTTKGVAANGTSNNNGHSIRDDSITSGSTISSQNRMTSFAEIARNKSLQEKVDTSSINLDDLQETAYSKARSVSFYQACDNENEEEESYTKNSPANSTDTPSTSVLKVKTSEDDYPPDDDEGYDVMPSPSWDARFRKTRDSIFLVNTSIPRDSFDEDDTPKSSIDENNLEVDEDIVKESSSFNDNNYDHDNGIDADRTPSDGRMGSENDMNDNQGKYMK